MPSMNSSRRICSASVSRRGLRLRVVLSIAKPGFREGWWLRQWTWTCARWSKYAAPGKDLWVWESVCLWGVGRGEKWERWGKRAATAAVWILSQFKGHQRDLRRAWEDQACAVMKVGWGEGWLGDGGLMEPCSRNQKTSDNGYCTAMVDCSSFNNLSRE